LIGSQTGGLRGVHADVESMRAALDQFGFDTTVLVERDATYAGILDAFRQLVDATGCDDAVVVYFSGHGGRQRHPNATAETSNPTWLQYLIPTDLDDDDGRTFRGILAERMSLLQRELTERTDNVTTILDCCHAARMSRHPSLMPKTPGRSTPIRWEAVQASLDEIRAYLPPDVMLADGSPLAVRLVACAPEETAYELALAGSGGPRGVLTATLARLLRQPGSVRLTWRQVIAQLRPAVMELVRNQRPELEGPVDRYLFSTAEQSATGVLPVLVERATAFLEYPKLFGVDVGDRYALVAPGADPASPIAVATVDRVVDGRARLGVAGASAATLPPGVEAHPLEVALGGRPVAVEPADHPRRPRIVDAMSRWRHVRVAEPDDVPMATVRLRGSDAELLDAHGEPLGERPYRSTGRQMTRLGLDLRRLALAAHLGNLTSGTGPDALPAGVDIECALLGEHKETRLASGAHLFEGDRVLMRFRNASGERRYVTVFDLGLLGAVSHLSISEPSGVGLEDGASYELYRVPVTNALTGVELYWPSGLPRGGPRAGTFLVITTDRPQDLRNLIQPGIRRGAVAGASTLQRIVHDLAAGVRRARPGDPPEAVRYDVRRFDFQLHPEPRPTAEPGFAVDERPDISFRLVPPGADGPVPPRVTVRIDEVVGPARGRMDALVVTATEHGWAHRATTVRLDGGGTETDVVLYEGPVSGALDIAIWVSTARAGLDLVDLLPTATATTSGAWSGARHLDMVAGLVTAADAALSGATRLYRESFLAHERFGAGEPLRRHPSVGLTRTPHASFAYEVLGPS
jgi:hypothetical protein